MSDTKKNPSEFRVQIEVTKPSGVKFRTAVEPDLDTRLAYAEAIISAANTAVSNLAFTQGFEND